MNYERPATLSDAVGMLQSSGDKAFVLAGGTDLLVRMKNDDFDAEIIVDIKSIEGIADIRETEEHYWIGAATTRAELGEHAGLRSFWPGVVEAANLIGSTQIQGAAPSPVIFAMPLQRQTVSRPSWRQVLTPSSSVQTVTARCWSSRW